jgi:rod shape determining protein RodA
MLSPFVYLKRFDWLLYGTSLLLAAFSLVVLYGSSLGTGEGPANFDLFWKQAVFAAAGLGLALILPMFDYRQLAGSARVLYVLAVVLLVAVLLFGTPVRGTRGWFGFFGMGIQPVELVKFLLIVFLARYFANYARDRSAWRPIIGSGLAAALIFILVVMQPDLGSALLLFTVWFFMLLLSGVRRRHLAALLAVFGVVALVAWMFVLKPYQQDRITSFLNPEADPQGRGWNVSQSIIAVGSGGVWGQGLGYGPQSQLRFLPERQTDFIFASAAEALGLMGVLLLLGLFGMLFYRGYRLAERCRDDFTLFLVMGICISIGAELVINIGGTIRMLPLTGVTLPFISYGGSSLLVKYLMVGTLQSIAVRQA